MAPDITEYIAYEVKKDIADRYFGFRKLIEDDEQNYKEKIRQYSYILEKRISFDLIRLYVLLKNESLIHDFMRIAGLEERLFYDSLLVETNAIRDRVFQGVHFQGFIRSTRFRNFGRDCYGRLTENIVQYAEKIEELRGMREAIDEEIKLFYRKNDICAILSFLRSMGTASLSGNMAGGMEVGMVESMEKKMKIPPPFPIEQYLPIIPPINPLDRISGELNALLKNAYRLHDQTMLAVFTYRLPFFSKKPERQPRS